MVLARFHQSNPDKCRLLTNSNVSIANTKIDAFVVFYDLQFVVGVFLQALPRLLVLFLVEQLQVDNVK